MWRLRSNSRVASSFVGKHLQQYKATLNFNGNSAKIRCYKIDVSVIRSYSTSSYLFHAQGSDDHTYDHSHESCQHHDHSSCTDINVHNHDHSHNQKNNNEPTTPILTSTNINKVITMSMPSSIPISTASPARLNPVNTLQRPSAVSAPPKMSFIIQRFKYLCDEPVLPVEEVLSHFQDIVKAYKANPIAYARHTPKLLSSLLKLNEVHGHTSLAFARASVNIYRFLGIVVPGGVNQLGSLDDTVARQAFQVLNRLEEEKDYDGCAEVLSLLATIPASTMNTTNNSISLRLEQLQAITKHVQRYYQLSAPLTLQGLHAVANILLNNSSFLVPTFSSTSTTTTTTTTNSIHSNIDTKSGLSLLQEIIRFYFSENDNESSSNDKVLVSEEVKKQARRDIAEVIFGIVSILLKHYKQEPAQWKLLYENHPFFLSTIVQTLSKFTPTESVSIARSILLVLNQQQQLSSLSSPSIAFPHHHEKEKDSIIIPWIKQLLAQIVAVTEEVTGSSLTAQQQQQFLQEKEESVRLSLQFLRKDVSEGNVSDNIAVNNERKRAFLEEHKLCALSLRLLLQEMSSSAPSIAILKEVVQFLNVFVTSPSSLPVKTVFWDQFSAKQGPSYILSLLTQSDVDHPQVTTLLLQFLTNMVQSTEQFVDRNSSESLLENETRNNSNLVNFHASVTSEWVDEGLCEELCRLLHHTVQVQETMLIAPILSLIVSLIHDNSHFPINANDNKDVSEDQQKQLESIRQRFTDAGLPPLLQILSTTLMPTNATMDCSKNDLLIAKVFHHIVQGESSFASDRRRSLFIQHHFPSVIFQYLHHSLRLTTKNHNSEITMLLVQALVRCVTPVQSNNMSPQAQLEKECIAEIVDSLKNHANFASIKENLIVFQEKNGSERPAGDVFKLLSVL